MSDTADQERFDKLRQYVDGLDFTKAQKSEFLMKEWDRICKEKERQAEREAAARQAEREAAAKQAEREAAEREREAERQIEEKKLLAEERERE